MIAVVWIISAMINAWDADRAFKRGENAWGVMSVVISIGCVAMWFAEASK